MDAEKRDPGSWIFSRDILSWLQDKELLEQLPQPYKAFAEYCDDFFAHNDVDEMPDGCERFQALITECSAKNCPTELGLQLSRTKIFINLEDPRFFQVVNELSTDNTDTELVKYLLKPGDSFFDIGANHGSFSLIAGKILGSTGSVLAVEAQPKLAKLVQQSLHANLTCDFTVHQVALGDKEGEIEFMIPEDSSGSAGVFAEHSATHGFKKVTVALQRFDDLIDANQFKPNGLLKLDIEGSEYNFLKGGTQSIKQLQPKIFLEINPGTLKASKVTIGALKEHLAHLGYTAYAELEDLERHIDLKDLDADFQRNIVVFPK